MIGQKIYPFDKLRYDTFLEILGKESNINIVATVEGNYSPDVSLTGMTDALQSAKDVHVVLSNADQHLLGAEIALADAGYNVADLYLMGGGAAEVAIEAIKAGQWDATFIGVPLSEGYLAAILAVLEPVAFILAIFLTNMAVSKQIRTKKQSISDDEELDIGMKQTKTKLSQVLKESITGKAIVILLGSIVIGYIIGKEGFEPISIVFDELFTGAIVIFMIEMGIIAGQRLEDIKKVGIFLTSFSIIIPTINGIIGVLVSTALGLSLGGAVMFGLLLASASFIAAPAVLRHAIPQANPSLYITSALGITFPYNIIVLLPIMFTISTWVHGEEAIDLFNYVAKVFI